MRNIISQFAAIFAKHDFFSDKFLCDVETSSGRFNSALKEAREYYDKRKSLKIAPELIHDSWSENIAALESYFAGRMNEDFISNEVINGTMVFTNREAHKLELKCISDYFGEKLVDEVVGKNLNASFLHGKSRRSTLINSTHHLHHLMRFEQGTGRKRASFDSVVEFGGGYGNMARIVQNLGSCETYSIVDLLLFSCIQYVFPSTVAGNVQVDFDDEDYRGNAKFLLHPLFRTDSPVGLRGELFLST